MCLAIFKPADSVIPEANLVLGWESNPDGAGFAYVKDGSVVVEKGFMKLKDFMSNYRECSKANRSSPFIIHFRIRSLGSKEKDNTHPFIIDGGALIHNGTISGTGADYNRGYSDTKIFSDTFKSNLTYEFVSNNINSLEEALGYNKIVILYDNGKHKIINEKSGHWKDDVWYSNTSYVSHVGFNKNKWNTYRGKYGNNFTT